MKTAKSSPMDKLGRSRMVDVSEKPITTRIAKVRATILMKKATLITILEGKVPKGDVFEVAKIAAIFAAKRCADLIPMCHPLPIDHVEVCFQPEVEGNRVHIECTVKTRARTGVEMEAFTAAAIAALTIYDMCKQLDRSITISDIYLLEKSGGKSGRYKLQCKMKNEK